MFLSPLSKFAASPIREEDSVAARLIKEGKPVIKLNTGDPAKYFKTPERVINAYIAALKNNDTYYSDSQGVQSLREAIAQRHRRLYNLNVGAERVIVTQGISEALQFINTALIGRGGKAVLVRPYYPSYMPYLNLPGGNAVFADASEANGWSVDADAIEKAVKDVKGIKYMLITTPNNPTGNVLQRETLKEIADIANDHGIFLISDEIYDELIFKGKFTSLSEVAEGMPYMIFNGVSKNFDATGFRVGYILLPHEDKKSSALLTKIIELARMRLSANTPAQFACAAGISDADAHAREVAELRDAIKERVEFATAKINESGYMHASMPSGAFYVFPSVDMEKLEFKDDKEFVNQLLLEEYVQVTRGSGFGSPNHIRIVALPPKETLSNAIDKITAFCSRHLKK
jgi:aspartate/methionine/tyrosine aminotransferase